MSMHLLGSLEGLNESNILLLSIFLRSTWKKKHVNISHPLHEQNLDDGNLPLSLVQASHL